MKILIISPSLDPKQNVSGISSVVNNIIKFGQDQYFHFELGSTDENLSNSILKKGYKSLSQFRKYYFFVKKFNPDIVHMNIPCNKKGILRESVILKINEILGKKSIAHLHGGEYLMKKPLNWILVYLFKRLLRRSDSVLVLSVVEKKSLKKLYGYFNIIVLNNSVDINLPYKIYENRRDKIRILYLGRIHESKGVEDLIIALKKLYKETKFEFILCGEGPLKDYVVKDLSNTMGDDFRYKGVVSGKEKESVISESDIFILPSRYGEGLPMALLETMSAGLIPVTTDDASMKYVINDNENGIIIEKNNPEDIYLKLKDLIQDTTKMTRLSINARKTIEEKYSLKTMIEKLECIYKDDSVHNIV